MSLISKVMDKEMRKKYEEGLAALVRREQKVESTPSIPFPSKPSEVPSNGLAKTYVLGIRG